VRMGRAHPNYGRLDVREAARLRREEGLSNEQIARRLGFTSPSVWRHLGPTPDELRQARQWNTGDTRQRAEEMRWNGYSVRRISYLLGVPPSTVGEWVKGQ
jgi:predicted transcriptional regulator